MSNLIKISVAAVALLYSTMSFAVPVYYGDRTSFDSATNGLTTEDFEGLTPAATMPNVTTADYTIDADPGGRPDDIYVTPAGFTPGITSNVVFANYFVDGMTIDFGAGINSFGADLFSLYSGSSFTISIFDTANNLIDSVILAVANSATFFGFTSDVMIGMINIDSASDQAEGIDNMTYGVSVPEPTTLLLMGLGLVGFGVAGRKKA